MINLLLIVLVWVGIFLNSFLGLLVYSRNRKSLTNRSLMLLAIFSAVWAAALFFFEHPIYLSSHDWLRLVYFVAIFLIFFIYFFSYVFPRRTTRSFAFPILVYAPLAVFFAYTIVFTRLFLVDVIKEAWGYRQILGPVYPLFCLWTSFFASWGIFNLFRSYKREKGIAKAQVRYIFLGIFLFSLTAIILDVIFPVFLKDSRFIWFSTIGAVFFISSTTYAVVRHRLMDIHLVIARSVAYIFLVVILGLFYAGGLFFASTYLFRQSTTLASLGASTALALIIAFTFQPLRRVLEKVTNRFLYRRGYEIEELLQTVSEVLTSTLDLDALTTNIIYILKSRMLIGKAGFALVNKKKIHILGIVDGKDFALTEGELDKLKAVGKILVFDELPEGEVKEIMRKSSTSIFLPLKTKEGTIGCLLLGEKEAGDIYFSQDLEILEIIGPQIAVALQNAKSYREIQEFSQTLEKKVEERTEELEEVQARELAKARLLLRLKDEFVFIATHDLRTPVTALTGFVDLIQKSKDKLSTDNKENLNGIDEAGERLNDLVDDLLEIARSESGTIKIKVKPVDIVPVIEDVLQRVTPSVKDKKITLKAELDKENRLVMGDEEKLAEVMENLLSNAIKFNRPGGKVKVVTTRAKDKLEVSVADTGYGIAKEEQEKVFQKFFKARTEKTKGVSGTGLGLFIVRMLVEKMKGKISFTSEEGKGTTFTFVLTLAKE